jgi:predicted pyridoxine 5'-phosphate oxidase superfamily flavin-nucleotide-binding protein
MLLSDEVKEFVLDQRLGYHATVNPDGTPNLSTKGTTSVYDDEHLFFADIRSPQTVANLRANPGIEVNVVDVFSRRGYRFKGTATVHQNDDVYRRGCELLRERGYGTYDERVRSIVLIRIQTTELLTSPAYDVGQTEAELVDHYIDYYVALHRTARPHDIAVDREPTCGPGRPPGSSASGHDLSDPRLRSAAATTEPSPPRQGGSPPSSAPVVAELADVGQSLRLREGQSGDRRPAAGPAPPAASVAIHAALALQLAPVVVDDAQ